MAINQTINEKSSSQPTQQITTETVIQTSELNNDSQVENSKNTSTDMPVSKISCKENSEFSMITGDTFSKMEYSKDVIQQLPAHAAAMVLDLKAHKSSTGIIC